MGLRSTLGTRGWRFKERMSGWISLDQVQPPIPFQPNIRYPFEINIWVFRAGWFGFHQPRILRGYAVFPGCSGDWGIPHLDHSPRVEGQMTLSLRGVRYQFSVELPGGGSLQFSGAKSYVWNFLRFSKFKKSLVELPLEVYRSGVRVGKAHLVYRDSLWKFPLSFRWVRETHGWDDLQNWAERLSRSASLFVPNALEITHAASLQQRLKLQLFYTPPFFRWWIQLTWLLIKVLKAPKRYGLTFWHLEVPKSQAVPFCRLTLPLSNLLFTAIYSDPEYLQRKHQRVPDHSSGVEDEPWMRTHFPPTSQNSETPIDVDVVIVGSGAGGGAAAYELARQGHSVAVVEEGAFFKRPDLTGQRIEMQGKLHRQGGYSFAISNAPFWLPTGMGVGGTTLINSGTCMRPDPRVFQRWDQELGLSSVDLNPFFPDVESMLRNQPVPTEIQGSIAGVLAKGIRGKPYELRALNRAEEGCDGQACCIWGCPTNAKRSTNVSYIPEAMRQGVLLFTGYRVEKLLFEGDRVAGIRAVVPGYGNEFPLTIRAKKTILAAGTLQTPGLLMRAGLRKKLKHLGRHLSVHPAINIAAQFKDRVRDSAFVPQSMGVFGAMKDRFVLEGYTLTIDLIPSSFLLMGHALKTLMDQVEHVTNFAAMITDATEGRVCYVGRIPLPLYILNAEMVSRFKESSSLLMKLFFDAGATTVYTPIVGAEQIDTVAQWEAFNDRKLKASDFLKLSAHHPLGTCRMGNHPGNSVVSPRGEVWGTRDLYVADGSAIPGPLGVNPQVTLMANALRIAREIGASLQ